MPDADGCHPAAIPQWIMRWSRVVRHHFENAPDFL